MNYNFIYDFEKYNQSQRPAKLRTLTDNEFDLVKHIYLNKNMITQEDLKLRIDNELYSETDLLPLEEIIKMASQPFDIDNLCDNVLCYISYIDSYYGPVEARKASKILLRKKKIVGIKTNDVINEAIRREISKKQKLEKTEKN